MHLNHGLLHCFLIYSVDTKTAGIRVFLPNKSRQTLEKPIVILSKICPLIFVFLSLTRQPGTVDLQALQDRSFAHNILLLLRKNVLCYTSRWNRKSGLACEQPAGHEKGGICMRVIVYLSNTGFTKKYAELLAQKTGYPIFALQDARKKLAGDAEIVYLGWVFAGSVKGYNKAARLGRIIAVCAVGMGGPASDQLPGLIKKHGLDADRAFYLQGGFDMNRLRGINKLMMKMMAKATVPQLESKPDKTPDELQSLELLKNGGDCVRPENLDPVLALLQAS